MMHHPDYTLSKFLTESKLRKLYLEIFCEIIEYTHSFGSEKWGVMIAQDGIRLHVGSLITTTIHSNSIWMALDSELLESNTQPIKKLLEADWDKGKWAYYTKIDTRNYFYRDPSKGKWKLIKHLHFETIKKAAHKFGQLNIKSQRRNDYHFLNYLQKKIHPGLPIPEYRNKQKTQHMQETGFWIIRIDPCQFPINNLLQTPSIKLSLKKGEHDFKKGDLGLIWLKATKCDENRTWVAGVYGIAEIMNEPYPDTTSNHIELVEVKLIYTKELLDNPLQANKFSKIQGFGEGVIPNSSKQVDCSMIMETLYRQVATLIETHIEKMALKELNNILELQKQEAKFYQATPRIREILSKRIERGAISRTVKKYNNYECQVCKALNLNPHGFKKKNGEPYIETHHIIPVSTLKQGALATLNLITVCACHHRQLHYGEGIELRNTDSYIELYIDNQMVIIPKIRLDLVASKEPTS